MTDQEYNSLIEEVEKAAKKEKDRISKAQADEDAAIIEREALAFWFKILDEHLAKKPVGKDRR